MLRAALVGAAVTLACIITPVVHFITFIPSAFIGGYIAGARLECTSNQAVALGFLMSAVVIVPVFAIALSIALLGWASLSLAIALSALLVMWVAVGGVLGATLGGASVRRQAAR